MNDIGFLVFFIILLCDLAKISKHSCQYYCWFLFFFYTGHVALSLVDQCALVVDQGKQRSLSKSVIDVCRMVYQAKCSLIKVS